MSGCVLAAAGLLGIPADGNGQGQAGAGGGGGNAPAGTAADNSPVGVAAREAARRLDSVKAAQDLLTAAEFDRSENRNDRS